jgi:prephenate dehydrogenase
MKVAVLGVGLIGGSIGLAARARLDAEVAGFDPDQELLARAEELGAIDSVHESVGAAVDGAELVFCAAPVMALPDLAAEALEHAGEETAVTDVGSVKRDVIAALGSDGRFIGGHPLAGAETSGVANSHADLFEGARWYLTPTSNTQGTLYDRVQRAIADIGARPQAIEAETHDRLMATISHLPHVVANVLVTQAATALSEESEHLPEVGPSFRDATRVAGANPALWPDIMLANRDALGAQLDTAERRLAEVRAALQEGDRDALARWQTIAAQRRDALVEAALHTGPSRELRLSVPNRPGVVAELTLALGREGINISDMSLTPAPDFTRGEIALWVAEGDYERALALVQDL